MCESLDPAKIGRIDHRPQDRKEALYIALRTGFVSPINSFALLRRNSIQEQISLGRTVQKLQSPILFRQLERHQAVPIKFPQRSLNVLVCHAKHAKQFAHRDTRREMHDVQDAVVHAAEGECVQRRCGIRRKREGCEEV